MLHSPFTKRNSKGGRKRRRGLDDIMHRSTQIYQTQKFTRLMKMYKVSFKRWPEFFMNALQKEYNLRYCPFCMIIVLVKKCQTSQFMLQFLSKVNCLERYLQNCISRLSLLQCSISEITSFVDKRSENNNGGQFLLGRN